MYVTVSSKGQIVIPSDIRKRYSIQEGDRLGIVEYGSHVSLVPVPDDPIAFMRGALKGTGLTTDDFVAERRAERVAEEDEASRWDR